MLTLIHGDDTEKSYQEFIRVRDSFYGKDIRFLDGKKITLIDLTEALESPSLFNDSVVVIIERLLGFVNKKTSLYGKYIEIILKSAGTTEIVIYENKEIDKTTLLRFGSDIVSKSFMIPKIIFEFLDGLYKGNRRMSLITFSSLKNQQPVELLFSMIVKRFRVLIQVKDDITPEGIAPWQAARLTRQARFFTIIELVRFYKRLATIEIAVKTGSSPFILAQHIQQFIGDL